MLCENCHQREATGPVCEIDGDVMKSKHLCDECREAGSGETKEFSPPPQPNARCEYCGAQPCSAGTDLFALVKGIQRLKFMCLSCSTEHSRYLHQRLNPANSKLSKPERLALLQNLEQELDEHMKRWVAERGSR